MRERRGRGRFAPRVVGLGFLSVAAAAAVFTVGALLAGDRSAGFASTVVVAGVLGASILSMGGSGRDPSRREALLSVLLLWSLMPAVSALPYAVGGGLSPLDALFESMSSFTTTGATVLVDFGAVDPSLFLWRALGQWVGGVGIIVLFIAVFPHLALAGRQIFRAEAPGPTEERLTPKLRHTAAAILTVYVSLSVACGLAYLASGLGPYDALAHALTTLAAGGFSPEARSFEAFGPSTQWVAIAFMGLAGANFALQHRALGGRPRMLFGDAEFRAYVLIALASGAILTWILLPGFGPVDAPRHALFQALSILTTTGYASTDFDAWSAPGRAVLVALMFVGGSAGSAAGGIKVVRLLIIAKHASREVRRALHPRAVMPVRVGRRVVSEEVVRAVSAFVVLYLVLFAATAGVLIAFGSDHVTSVTAALATLGNVGPGLGAVGPMASFATLPDVSKAMLVFAMYAGRLEVVTVFVLFTGDWWKLPRTVRKRIEPRFDRRRFGAGDERP